MYLQRATHPLLLCQLRILLPVSTLHPSMGLTWPNSLTWDLSLPFGLWALFKPLHSYAASRFLPTKPSLLMVLADLILALSCHCIVLDCLLIVVAANRPALLALLRCRSTAPIPVKTQHILSVYFLFDDFPIVWNSLKSLLSTILTFYFFSNHPSYLLP